jgi:Raf kinase inhibitor-like YbhB/YbcL family protein
MSRASTLTIALPFLTAASLLLASAPVSGDGGTQDSRANMTSAKLGAPPASMKVTSKAFAADSAIPEKHSGYSQSVSPELQWSGAPPSTSTFALVMEDPDAKAMAPEPFVHWIAYNIPALTMSLPEGVPPTPDIKSDGMQGLNGTKASGYFGPRPPAGDPPHHYHFQVFALDAELPLKAGASKAALIAAMKGHVVGWGELVGTYKR